MLCTLSWLICSTDFKNTIASSQSRRSPASRLTIDWRSLHPLRRSWGWMTFSHPGVSTAQDLLFVLTTLALLLAGWSYRTPRDDPTAPRSSPALNGACPMFLTRLICCAVWSRMCNFNLLFIIGTGDDDAEPRHWIRFALPSSSSSVGPSNERYLNLNSLWHAKH